MLFITAVSEEKQFKEGMQLAILLNGPPTLVTYPPDHVYEEPLENHTQAVKRDRKIRNQ